MKNKLSLVMFMLCLMVPLALAQTDEATGTMTNGETQARLRVNHCVFNGPNVDVLIDGEIAINGGVQQTDQDMGVTGYLYLEPGTYSVAAVPTGKGVEEALMKPVDVTVQARHRYTVAVLGQADEPSYTPLVIDETAAYQAIGALPSESTQSIIDNIRGVPGIDVSVGGEVRLENVPYGGYKTAVWPTGIAENMTITLSGTSDELFPEESNHNISATNVLNCTGGTYPGTLGENYNMHHSNYTSTLNTVEFLQVQNEVAAQDGGHTFTFNTFLNAVETAGLSDLLTTGSPYMLSAPTDEAFAALPEEELDALMADPESLSDLLRAHIAPGYYPPGSLNRDGGRYAMVANGNSVVFVTKLLPPEH